jgi:hypothetical protein
MREPSFLFERITMQQERNNGVDIVGQLFYHSKVQRSEQNLLGLLTSWGEGIWTDYEKVLRYMSALNQLYLSEESTQDAYLLRLMEHRTKLGRGQVYLERPNHAAATRRLNELITLLTARIATRAGLMEAFGFNFARNSIYELENMLMQYELCYLGIRCYMCRTSGFIKREPSSPHCFGLRDEIRVEDLEARPD